MGTPNDPKIDPDSWAEQIFRSLTISAQELRCLCIPDEPYYLDAINHNEWEWLPGEGNYKYYIRVCTTCKRPPRYALSTLVHYCEGCDHAYVPKGLPDKFRLCGPCSTKVLSRPKRRRSN